MTISHKIELIPNNKAKTYFKKAFGCSRLAYNWGLAKWQEYYKQGIKKSHLDLKKEFNSIKKEQFPFVYEISKYATQQPFIYLNLAFQAFFRDLKKGKLSYPRFKKKKDNQDSFYLGGDTVKIIQKEKAYYLNIPNLGYIKLRENLKFKGKIHSVTISQKANRFYASFSVNIDENEFNATHKQALQTKQGLGIDVGLKSFVSLSNGLSIQAPKPLYKLTRKLKRVSRQLSKKQHPKTKGDATKKSNNYIKQSLKLNKLHAKIANIRSDFLHKLTSSLVRHYAYFGLENLNIKAMVKNHRLAKAISDVSFYEFKRQLQYKSLYYKREVLEVNRFYPSSKQCSQCGSIKENLTLKDRIYECENCGMKIDRDYNASLNLYNHITQEIGQVLPKSTPEDLTALQVDLAINNIATSKVETGI
ncbi:RNA-guided endonuclease InsQ/TnpB family protein [Helicobacter canadensis]|uniref:Transposase n=1 Tax=Helicobacter canadensis MIT 98-5491 TaxID=537970 RepID=C5ZXP5_9HELI|nr:RNA-guided endonuclease TnpB family protein [Helicobacter canadensis]EES89913.1 putative transposase [Helicobacter canadensis MIT 98-5491]EFR49059.1 transposase, IS605 OrfB family [Helicobacter canadensis MIT 98-5491]STP02587.1 transposase [Helicobacter canadensis]